jgi:hypothetical protein
MVDIDLRDQWLSLIDKIEEWEASKWHFVIGALGEGKDQAYLDEHYYLDLIKGGD